jgi:hypothetical protein
MSTNREWIFYAAAGAAVLLNELAIHYGVYWCISLPLTLGVVAIGFWAFPKKIPDRRSE